MKGFDKGLLTGLILINLQKAFDTIDHYILLLKLNAIGLCHHTVNWFKFFLSDRVFLVNVDNQFSNISNITCGVPQGSIPGSLLFLIYVNDISQAVSSNLLPYADDLCLLFQHKNEDVVQTQLNNDFSHLCEWFLDNKLSIHFSEDKTKSILFGTKHQLKRSSKLKITYDGINIKQYQHVTYLGCILDEAMSGETIAQVIKKINSRLNFLYRKNNFLSPLLR